MKAVLSLINTLELNSGDVKRLMLKLLVIASTKILAEVHLVATSHQRMNLRKDVLSPQNTSQKQN